ncbi:hypothetical protein K437DRAFT_225605 [Tilletiaria anomala UBC 951]|uniref:Uncharacterized protein n=1 Tax=Tilletiaria anomala (strain ATCC 24038 / CBS 436.72 / UBC 951) TaxID=1037660 RepID=A0A066VX94_TILAU|nr:uncharacterized protein K437DRAFT_225605 [Tilletiaria anomala UBC 951]KDN43429.1 hypothetical protein K437DRAFT_225605 [Tilletiaria anomala UBC 951]
MDPEREIEEAAQLVTSEPVSYLDILTPSAIPACEDPLAYVPEAKTLLEADAEEELLQRQDQRRKLAEQESLRGVLYRARAWVQHHLTVGGGIRLTNLQRGLLKCFIAYFLASLCTFSPVLSRRLAMLLPNHDPDKKVPISNLHMIATVSVYFHPAKTLGAMLEADMYALVGFVYSLLLTTLSMLTAVFLHNLDLALLSNFLIVSIFLGGGMGFMAWAKVRMASPSFNTACSMIGIVVFTVMIKEGAAHLGRFSSDKSLQVTICVISGVFISNLICFAIGPQSATKALQADIRRNLTGFATLLKVLTKTFLLDDPRNFSLDSERIKQAIDDHHTSFTSLKKNLREAQMERMLDARMRGQAPARYADVVGSMNRLAQHLGGLRSSCGLQQRIISKQKEATAAAAKQAAMESEAAARRPEAGGEDPFAAGEAEVDADNDGQWKARTDAFGDFVQFIGPHMRSLVFTSSRTLRNLRSAFLTAGDVALPEVRGNEQHNVAREASFASTATQPPQHNHYIPGSSFTLLSEDVRLALERFRHEQSISIKRIYENTMYDECRSVDQLEAVARATKSLADEEIMPDEQVFLVFFFVFNLEEFAKELQYLTAALEQIRQQEERIVRRRAMPMQQWLKSLCTCDSMPSFSLRGRRHSCRQGRRKMKEPQVTFPDYRPHQVNTGQTPAADTLNMRMSRVIWSLGNFLRRPDIKFSIKTGVGAALMAAPAFIHATRPIFKDYQGQWALVSYMIVMSPTVGQSNQMSFQRIAGTVIGAGAAYTAYTLFPDNNVALPIFGALFSVPCFWAIVAKPQHASAGRFVLLTYNLTALYSYNLRKLGIEVEQIAIKRMISVIIGVTWASLLTHLVWPMEARRQLAEGMADLMFKLSYLYQRLVLSYSAEPPDRPATMPQHDWEGDEESRPLLAPDEGSRQRDQFQPLELQLQVAIIRLEGLLVQTKHEPRLKGPFPIAKYKAMINSCQSILDKLHSMRCVTGRDAWHHLVRRDFVIPVNPYRREMVGNVLLYFYILGSAFHLKSPLPPYLPAANAARKALLERIRALPVVRKRQVRGGTEYLLFYSYALAMKEVIEQLEHLGRIAQDNFGVLGGGVESFEQQFRHAPASTAATPRLSTIGISASEQQR